MDQIQWELKNFSLGQHTDMARAGEGAERFARQASGVRVDENGHLRPRVAFRQFGELADHAITGVVAGANYLLYLRADSSLWIRFGNSPDEEREIRFGTPSQVSGITGALSLVGEFADFIIIKGQGGDPWWIDMREDSNWFLNAYRLGLDPPQTIPPNVTYDTSEDGQLSVLLRGFIYFYRWTYVRAIGDNKFKILDGEYHQVGTLFNGMESNPSPAMGVYRDLGDAAELVDVIDNDGKTVETVVAVDDPNDDLVVFDWLESHSPDPQVTGIMLYQSEPVDALKSLDLGTINVDALQYRRIDYVPRTQESSVTGQAATPARWSDMPLLRFDNNVMPDTERVTLYNDRIFVQTPQGLQFSDIDGTILRLWAFPETHAIRRSGVKDAVAHRGVLLFGGPADLHSLTGTSAFDFQVNRLGTLGPVSAHAMQVLKDSVAFAGSSGFFITDTVQVQKISDALNTEFEDYETTYGHCHQLPDDSIIFIVQQRHEEESPRRMTYHYDGGWFSWPRFNIHQMARWRVPGTRVMMADLSHALRELVWKVTPDAADDSARDHEDWIEWSWESQRLNFGTETFKSFREVQLQLQALSVIPQGTERWTVNTGEKTVATAFTWSLGGKVLILGGAVLSEASVPAPVRLTVWVDDSPPMFKVFEAQRDEYRPMRIQLNRKGRAIKFRLEGRGHLQLQSIKLIGAM